MTGHLEREVKLDADPDLELPDLNGAVPGLVAMARPTLDLDATYFDAGDGRLLEAGVTLRRRTGEGTRWTVKLPSHRPAPAAGSGGAAESSAAAAAAAVHRREIDVHDIGLAVPAEVAELVAPWLGKADLVAVARLVSHRRRQALGVDPTGAGALAELDDDLVVVHVVGDGSEARAEAGPVPDAPVGRFREIEVEQADADQADAGPVVAAVVARLLAAGARPAPTTSKLARALELAARR